MTINNLGIDEGYIDQKINEIFQDRKEEIVKGLNDAIVKKFNDATSYWINHAIEDSVKEYFTTVIIPEVFKNLETKKVELIEAMTRVYMKSIDVMMEAVIKGLSDKLTNQYKTKDFFSALFKD